MKTHLLPLFFSLLFSNSLSAAAVSWTGGGNGTSWNDGTNWSTGLVPGAADDVTIDIAGDVTVTISTNVTVQSLSCQESLTVASGGNLTLTAGPSTIAGTLQVDTSRTITTTGATTSLVASGPATIDNANLSALAGSTISITQLTVLTHNANNDMTLRASGADSELLFPNLTTFNPRPSAGNDVFLNALDGGRIAMPVLTVVNDGAATFKADGAGSEIDLPMLSSFDGYIYFTDSGFRATNGGAVNIPVLTTIHDAHMVIDATSSIPVSQITSYTGEGTIDLNNAPALSFTSLTTLNHVTLEVADPLPALPLLSDITNASIRVSGGVSLSLPLITGILHDTNNDMTLQASGTSSILSFPNLTTINPRPNAGDDIFVNALAGGRVEMPSFATMTDGALTFKADGAGSSVDLSILASFDGYIYFTDSGFRAINGGTIHMPSLATIHDANMVVDAASSMQVAQITSYTGVGTFDLTNPPALTFSNLANVNVATISVGSPVPSFPLLSDIDNGSVQVWGGANLSLPLITTINHTVNGDMTLQASGASSVLSFPNLTAMNPRANASDDIFINAVAGGRVEMPALTAVNDGAATFKAQGASSYLDLSALASFDGYLYFTDSGFRAVDGGTIHCPLLTAIHDANLQIDAASSMTVAQITSYSGVGTLALNSAPALAFTGLTSLNGLTLQITNTLPTFPALSNIDNSSIFVAGGLSFSLPLVTTVNHTDNNDMTWQASGAGSSLSLPNLTTINPRADASDDHFINALSGGSISLPSLSTVNDGACLFRADGLGSVVDATALTACDGYRYFTDSGFRALNEGVINLHPSATIQIKDANIQVLSGGVITGGTLLLEDPCDVVGDSLLDANVLSHVHFQPNSAANNFGTISIGGNFTQYADGAVTLQVGGLTPGLEHDQLSIGGTATLDGTLTVNNSSFTPFPGNEISLLEWSGAAGSFSSITLPDFGDDIAWEPRFLPASLDLAAIITRGPFVLGTGDGLTGEYFDDITLTNSVLTRVDPEINFDWDTGAPDPSLPVDYFSARWTGSLLAPVTGNYTLTTFDDDGIRLWLDLDQSGTFEPGELLIDDFTVHSLRQHNSPQVALAAGELYPIKIEYFENGVFAICRLFWTVPGTSLSPLPGSQLYSAEPDLTAAPTISPAPDTYQQSVTVTLGSATGGSQVRYTTDGSPPTVSSPLYSGPLTFTADTFLQARAFSPGSDPSPILHATYFVEQELPDLLITSLTAPATVTPGQTVSLSWTVQNNGLGDFSGTRVDSFALSGDASAGPDDVVTVSFPVTGTIPASGSQSYTMTYTAPFESPNGTLYFVGTADANDSHPEANQNNNTFVSPTTTFIAPTLRLTSSRSSIQENASNPNFTLTLSRNGDLASPLTVALAASDGDEFSFPVSVEIPAGSYSTPVPIAVLNDGVTDGNQLVTLTASTAGYSDGTTSVTAIDSSPPSLMLFVVDNPITEGGMTDLSITRNPVTSAPLVVTLTNPSSNQLMMPTTVTIPGNQASTMVTVGAIDDELIEGTRTYQITAASTGFIGAGISLSVLDGDLPSLALSVSPSTLSESAGSQAGTATLTRTPASPSPLTIELTNTNASALSAPTSVTIPANQTSASFAIGPIDNSASDGTRVVNLQAHLRGNDNSVVASTPLVPVQITDDEAPSLALNLPRDYVAEGDFFSASVSRQPVTASSLAVTLSFSDPTQASTNPVTVFIPANQASASFVIAGTDDGSDDGSQSVLLDATAPGHNNATAQLVVTDDQLPDLVATGLVLPATGKTNETLQYSYTLANQGTGELGTPVLIRTWLSTDRTKGNDIQLNQRLLEASLPPDTFLTFTESFRTPNQSEEFYLLVEVDTDQSIDELVETNNLAASSNAIVISPAYQTTVETDTTTAPAGSQVEFHGSAFDGANPAVFSLVNIHISVRGSTRVISALTDSNGDFSTTWTPFPGEAGTFTIGASHPSEDSAPAQDSFTLYGIDSDPDSLAVEIIADAAPATFNLAISNPSDLPLNGVSANLSGVASGLTASLTLGDGSPSPTLPGFGSINLALVLSTSTGGPTGDDFTIELTTSEGATRSIPVEVTVIPSTSQLRATPGQLEAGMTPGSQTFVNFDITNHGVTATGPISLSLPPADWLSSATATPLAPLAPGQSTTITLQLCPDVSLPLGLYTGSLVVSGATNPLQVPFSFRALSEETGDLHIVTEDELTYWGEGNPPLGNVDVTLRDIYTKAVVASGITDANGELLIEDVMEGFYELRCEAEKHSIYRNNIYVAPGRVNEARPFLFKQTVSYTFVVDPIQIQEETIIRIETVFETNVPLPVVTVDPVRFDLDTLEGPVNQVNYTIENHGLISANDLTMSINAPPGWQITPVATSFGDLPALSKVVVPVIFERVPSSVQDDKAGGCGGGSASGGSVNWKLECGGNENGYGSGFGFGGGGGGGAGSFGKHKCAVNPVGGGGGGGSINVNGAASLSSCSDDNCLAGAILDCLSNFLPPPLACIWGAMRCAGSLDPRTCILNMIGCAAGFTPAGPIVGAILCLDGIIQCDEKSKDGGREKASAVFAPFFFQYGILYGHMQTFREVFNELLGDPAWLETMPTANFYLWSELFAESVLLTSEDGEFLSASEIAALEAFDLGSTATPEMNTAFLQRWNRSLQYWLLGYQSAADVPNGDNADFIEPVLFAQKIDAAVVALDTLLEDDYTDPITAVQDKVFENVGVFTKGGGICARVTLLIEQQAILTRDAFDARLELDNMTSSPLTDIELNLIVQDENGADVTSLFNIQTPTITNINSGVLAPDSTGRFSYLIIPSDAAAPVEAKVYTVSGTLTYREGGTLVNLPLAGQDISVFPNADLHLKYFQQRDVYADDPFTLIVEPSIPFSLAVMAENVGAGTARDLRITSSQPEIIENEKGLFIDFEIIATEVDGQPLSPSLTANFGDIEPGEIKTARWLMTSTLHGHFIEFDATFEHTNEFGLEDFATISEVNIHEMIHEVSDQRPGSDALPDFLTNDLPDPNDYPDTVHVSDGTVESVTALLTANTTAPTTGMLSVPLTFAAPAGFVYLRVPEPSDATMRLVSVTRSDGRVLPLDVNAWTTDRTFIGYGLPPVRENKLHLFDHDSTGSYTLTYAILPPPDNSAPVSQVATLPAGSFEQFTVNWSGSDNDRVTGYDIYVSVAGAPYERWLSNTTRTSAIYEGTPDTSYAFYSIAIDPSGNRELAPGSPDASTMTSLDNSPPLLDAIADRTLDENTILEFLATASDPDNSGPIVYSLAPGAPANMTINSSTGRVRWPIGETAGGSSYGATVIATDGAFPYGTSSQSFTVTVTDTNETPVLRNSLVTLRENESFIWQVPASDSDLPAQVVTYRFTGTPPAGMTMNASGEISWTAPDLTETTQFNVGLEVEDNGSPAKTKSAILTLTVLNVSAPPVINFPFTVLDYPENSGPKPVAHAATISDPDSETFTGGSLIVSLSGATDSDERLLLVEGAQSGGKILTRSENVISIDGVAIATLLNETATGLNFSLNGNATPANTAGLIRGIIYQHLSETPTPGARQVTVVLNDGDLGVSDPVSRTIQVTAVLDPPAANNDQITTIEDATLRLSRLLENDSDVEGGTLSITAADGSTTAGGTVVRSGNILTYTPAGGFTGADSFSYTVTASGTGLTDTATVFLDIQAEGDYRPRISRIHFDSTSGMLSIEARDTPNATYSLLRSANLQTWTRIGFFTPDATGTLKYTTSPTNPQDFFRLQME